MLVETWVPKPRQSPIILASLHISGCNMLLTMPIMSPQCSLTRVMLCALIAFVKYQESEVYVVVPSVTQTRLHAFGAVHVCDPLHNTRHSGASSVMGRVCWTTRIQAANQLMTLLGGRSLKRVNRSRSAHGRQRRAVDRKRILGMSPIDDLGGGSPRARQRNGVVPSFIDCGSGFLLCCSFPSAVCITFRNRGGDKVSTIATLALICLEREYGEVEALSRIFQGQANAIMVGIIYCNGFDGRCMEWSILELGHFMQQIKAGCDHAVCDQHKTCHLCGDLAKWWAPGTTEAMKVYGRLPRRSNVMTFLHPANTGPNVNVHKALKRFGMKFLQREYVPLTSTTSCKIQRSGSGSRGTHRDRTRGPT